MSGHLVLLAVCAYFLLANAFHLGHQSDALNASFDPLNTLNARALVTDTSANDYLTLLSAPHDEDDPNPVDKGYVHDDSGGEGTTIFVLDGGFNLDKYPEEQCLDQRRIDHFLVPASYRYIALTDADRQAGLYYPPESMDDTAATTSDRKFHGHGTQIAILAAGCKTGVAPKANLYLIKISESKMRPDGLADSSFVGPLAQVYALQRVAAVIRGVPGGPSVPKGKAVVVMAAAGWSFDEMGTYGSHWDIVHDQFLFAMTQLERLGVTVVIAAGNKGSTGDPEQPNQEPSFVPQYLDQEFPQASVTEKEPPILVGATNNKGQLSSFTTPGRQHVVVSLYAQGANVKSTDLLSSEPDFREGTSYSTPIVAGLAAYTLGLPSNSHLCQYNPSPAADEDSVGLCLKKYLVNSAFQRVASTNLLAEDAGMYRYPIPATVLVASNGASAATEEEEGGEPFGDPTPCWSDDTRKQCRMANTTRT
ncbi:hypothetical protein Daus18300_008337 [Diaporthe australafricana]|uniref:Peptidase S8/S53 domain-containing protein n=1 Tax=Diaporthe australafricana TaxID=127596 RepID=A0ABR3WIM9_9PEZI